MVIDSVIFFLKPLKNLIGTTVCSVLLFLTIPLKNFSMKKFSAFFVFAFLSVAAYGQQPFSLTIEFPDHSANGHYITFSKRSVPGDFVF